MNTKNRIIIATSIKSDMDTVWEMWKQPRHIKEWNSASADWHTTKAENDLKTGGEFSSRMEAKDGSMGFDFSGKYDRVIPNEKIEYTLDDDRKVSICFEKTKNGVKVTETFEAEKENSEEMQKQGWQAILDNFKKYVESR